MTPKITLTKHRDEKNSWVAVPKRLFDSLAYKATRYSHHSDSTYFLDYDIDWPPFLELASQLGHTIELYEKNHGDDCFVKYLEKVAS